MNNPILRDFTKATLIPGENVEDRINRVHEDLFDIRLRLALLLKDSKEMNPDERADLDEMTEKTRQAWEIIDSLFTMKGKEK